MYKALEVKKDIFWTGSLDPNLRVFDIIMYSDYGTTYNSYIVKGEEKTVLFEISKETFFDQFIERASEVISPEKLDYVVVSHTEPDHTGSLAKLLKLNPNLQVVGSATAIKFLKEITNKEFNSIVVKDGDTLNIGGKTLQFISVPFLHWPDSIYTYIPESKTIFTCDSFGCHYSDEKVFNDLIGYNEDFNKAYKYYFDCIMGPFKSFILQALNKIKDLDIETICNGHGPVIRENPQKYIDMYRNWAQPVEPENKITVAYLTSYGYTKKLAEKIAEGIKSTGLEVKLINLLEASKEDALTEIASSKGFLLGSPTLIGDTLPPIWHILSELNPIIHKGLKAGAFGSYGWSGEAVDNIEGRLKQLRFKIPVAGYKVCFNPSEEQLEGAFAFGAEFAKA